MIPFHVGENSFTRDVQKQDASPSLSIRRRTQRKSTFLSSHPRPQRDQATDRTYRSGYGPKSVMRKAVCNSCTQVQRWTKCGPLLLNNNQARPGRNFSQPRVHKKSISVCGKHERLIINAAMISNTLPQFVCTSEEFRRQGILNFVLPTPFQFAKCLSLFALNFFAPSFLN